MDRRVIYHPDFVNDAQLLAIFQNDIHTGIDSDGDVPRDSFDVWFRLTDDVRIRWHNLPPNPFQQIAPDTGPTSGLIQAVCTNPCSVPTMQCGAWALQEAMLLTLILRSHGGNAIKCHYLQLMTCSILW